MPAHEIRELQNLKFERIKGMYWEARIGVQGLECLFGGLHCKVQKCRLCLIRYISSKLLICLLSFSFRSFKKVDVLIVYSGLSISSHHYH